MAEVRFFHCNGFLPVALFERTASSLHSKVEGDPSFPPAVERLDASPVSFLRGNPSSFFRDRRGDADVLGQGTPTSEVGSNAFPPVYERKLVFLWEVAFLRQAYKGEIQDSPLFFLRAKTVTPPFFLLFFLFPPKRDRLNLFSGAN